MDPIRAVSTVVVTAALGGGAGTGIGWLLGTQMPNYYRSVFMGGSDPNFDPVAVGIGQGLTQGLAGGLVVGTAIVALLVWREIIIERARQSRIPPPTIGSEP